MNMLGMELLDLSIGYAKGRIKFRQDLCNPYNSIHGGCLFSLADTISGIAAYTYGNKVSTVSASLNYLNPALNTTYIYCSATIIKHGKTLSVCNVELTDDNDKIIDTGTFTFFNLKAKGAVT